MKVARIYTGQDGETHVGEYEFPDDEKRVSDKGSWSKPIKPEMIELMEMKENKTTYEWHNSHRRMMAITIAGTHEIETSDGNKHIAAPGDIVIFDDSTGKGHISRNVTPPPHKMVFVLL